MQVKDLRDITRLMSMCGKIDEFHIDTSGHAVGIDPSKTAVAILDYKIELKLPRKLFLTNIAGIDQLLSKFEDKTEITILENSLHVENGEKMANIVLTVQTEPLFKLPNLTDDMYEIVAENIDHNILNKLGQLRPKVLINEVYNLYASENKLLMRVGEESDTKVWDIIGTTSRCTVNGTMRFEDNVAECFRSITTSAKIKILLNQLMMVECTPETYEIRYYLAPKVD